MLAEDAAVAALARSVVVALRIDGGGVGPEEYYRSPQEYLEAVTRAALTRHRAAGSRR